MLGLWSAYLNKIKMKTTNNVCFENNMSHYNLTNAVANGSWSIASRHDGRPSDNELIMTVGKKHKVGFFESVHKLIRRSAMEDEETCTVLWNANLIGFKNNSTGEEYALDRVGTINELYNKL